MTFSLYIRRKSSFSLFEINLLEASDNQLKKISRDLGIGLNLQEMKKIKTYYKMKKRQPTDVELQTIGQTWSEHCYHKTFKGKIMFNGKEIDNLFRTYIQKVTDEIKPPWCLSVFED